VKKSLVSFLAFKTKCAVGINLKLVRYWDARVGESMQLTSFTLQQSYWMQKR